MIDLAMYARDIALLRLPEHLNDQEHQINENFDAIHDQINAISVVQFGVIIAMIKHIETQHKALTVFDVAKDTEASTLFDVLPHVAKRKIH